MYKKRRMMLATSFFFLEYTVDYFNEPLLAALIIASLA